jgi:hypothetical protein
MLGMNATAMTTYIQFVADRLLLQMGFSSFTMLKIHSISWSVYLSLTRPTFEGACERVREGQCVVRREWRRRRWRFR